MSFRKTVSRRIFRIFSYLFSYVLGIIRDLWEYIPGKVSFSGIGGDSMLLFANGMLQF